MNLLWIFATFTLASVLAASMRDEVTDATDEIIYDSSDETLVPNYSEEGRRRADTEPSFQHVCSAPRQLRRKSLPSSEAVSKDSERPSSRRARTRTSSFYKDEDDDDDSPVPKDAFADIPVVPHKTLSRRFSLRSSRSPSFESIPEEEGPEEN